GAMTTVRRKWWLCVAPASVCALDAAVTLAFQPAAYWAGQFDKVGELSPLDRWMLLQHPLVFVAWVCTWITAFSLVLLWLPTRASLALAVMLILGNATGASSWVNERLPGGFWISYGLFLLIQRVVDNYIEPRLTGHKLGLSPLIILLSLAFWGGSGGS